MTTRHLISHSFSFDRNKQIQCIYLYSFTFLLRVSTLTTENKATATPKPLSNSVQGLGCLFIYWRLIVLLAQRKERKAVGKVWDERRKKNQPHSTSAPLSPASTAVHVCMLALAPAVQARPQSQHSTHASQHHHNSNTYTQGSHRFFISKFKDFSQTFQRPKKLFSKTRIADFFHFQ